METFGATSRVELQREQRDGTSHRVHRLSELVGGSKWSHNEMKRAKGGDGSSREGSQDGGSSTSSKTEFPEANTKERKMVREIGEKMERPLVEEGEL